MAKVNFWKINNREEELAQIYQRMSLEQLAIHFNTTIRAVQVKLSLLGLKKGHAVEPVWTEEKDQYLRVFAGDKTPYEMAQKLRLTTAQVEVRMRQLGVAEEVTPARSTTVCGQQRPPARYGNPDYTRIADYYQKERQSYYAG